jgi:maltose alpha-D-glucosyltransferase/alpha-amylase
MPEPTWYKDAIIYELHVRSFFDANNDGIGDFKGLIQKLDHIAELGATAIWLLPFYPSPLKDDGYDIADYRGVNPAYGGLSDFRKLIAEAHGRGLRVITELVCNHTSDQHPWFQRARRARPGSSWRNFYVWSDTTDLYRDARIIFKDFETSNWAWDSVAGAHYWHRFYSHQPDLNFDNPSVKEAIFRVVDHWLGMGVDGLRLDAIPYLYERDGTSCENLPESHAFLRDLRTHVDAHFSDRLLLAEANQWPEDAAAYFGAGDECHMAFHFPLMPRLFMGLRMEDRFPIVDILAQTPSIPDTAQWAIFLRNHDELTLEMVTDEERDYMYRAYTQDPEARINLGIRRRLAPLLGNNRRRIELMNGLLFSLPGTPVVYYGDEIGMGDNIYLGDRNGVRTPMQWSPDRNAGFSRANRQRLYLPPIVDPEYHYEAINVEAQQANPQSLLGWTRRLIALRRRHQAFGRGELEMVYPDNRRVLAFIRHHGPEQILVIANLSRFAQAATLDLSRWEGLVPVELFGRNEFKPIDSGNYHLTLGPHSFYWLGLEPGSVPSVRLSDADVPELVMSGRAPGAGFSGSDRAQLEEVLPSYLQDQRWFGGKGRRLAGLSLRDQVSLGDAVVNMLEVRYRESEPETYVLPLAFTQGERAERVLQGELGSVIARAQVDGSRVLLQDALSSPGFAQSLLDTVADRRRLKGESGELVGISRPPLEGMLGGLPRDVEAMLTGAEQSNNSVIFGERLILKLYRRIEEGAHPELELLRRLSSEGFANAVPLAGWLEYRRRGGEPALVALLQGYVPNQGSGWDQALAAIAEGDGRAEYQEWARLLGRRTGELHVALAGGVGPAFVLEPTAMSDARSIYQSIRVLGIQVVEMLSQRLQTMPPAAQPVAVEVIASRTQLLAALRHLLDRPIAACRMRGHGDLHLGQVLFTGSDYVFIDFEGEPARRLAERRLKRWSLRDVAGMLRSFDYAAETASAPAGWAAAAGEAYLAGYLDSARGAAFLRSDDREVKLLLRAMLLEKALYEVRYELENRPEWVGIPLRGLLDLIQSEAPA